MKPFLTVTGAVAVVGAAPVLGVEAAGIASGLGFSATTSAAVGGAVTGAATRAGLDILQAKVSSPKEYAISVGFGAVLGFGSTKLAEIYAGRGISGLTNPLVSTSESASTGITRVSRWMSEGEADTWVGRSSIPQPGAASGTPPRTFVTEYGAPQPGGTGPVRVDFNVSTQALQPAGRADWFTIFNESRDVPIHDVIITRP